MGVIDYRTVEDDQVVLVAVISVAMMEEVCDVCVCMCAVCGLWCGVCGVSRAFVTDCGQY